MQQGYTLAVPCGPCCLTLSSGWEEKKIQVFLKYHMRAPGISQTFFLEHSLALQAITLFAGLSPAGPFKREPWKRDCTTRTMTSFLTGTCFCLFVLTRY